MPMNWPQFEVLHPRFKLLYSEVVINRINVVLRRTIGTLSLSLSSSQGVSRTRVVNCAKKCE